MFDTSEKVSVAIPQDIIDHIIAAIGVDTHLLKQCALVSSSFLIPSRKQLFSKIYIRDDQASQRLYRVFIQNPAIQSFVRSLDVHPHWDSLDSPLLLAILRLSFCCLESFSIDLWNAWNWNNLSCELKDALSNIIHSSTLKTLHLKDVANVPTTLFLDIVHLTELTLTSVRFDGEQSTSLTLAASKGMATTSHPVIDHCVWLFWTRDRGRGTTFPTSPLFLTNSGHGRS